MCQSLKSIIYYELQSSDLLTVKNCTEPARLLNGQVHCSSEQYVFGTICNYTCDGGYLLVGENSKRCLAVKGEMWSGHHTECRGNTKDTFYKKSNTAIVIHHGKCISMYLP